MLDQINQSSTANEMLENCSEEERALLMRLCGGKIELLEKINEPKKEAKPTTPKQAKPKKASIKPYVLGHRILCTTCGTVTFNTFWMCDGVRGTGIDCLVSASLIPVPDGLQHEPEQWVEKRVGLCMHCEKVLQTKTKEELIAIIIGKRFEQVRKDYMTSTGKKLQICQ